MDLPSHTRAERSSAIDRALVFLLLPRLGHSQVQVLQGLRAPLAEGPGVAKKTEFPRTVDGPIQDEAGIVGVQWGWKRLTLGSPAKLPIAEAMPRRRYARAGEAGARRIGQPF